MVGFILLVAAVPVAAYFVLRWYAYDNWIVTLQGDQIVVKQGQAGGVLWFHPKVVDRTGKTTAQIAPTAVALLRAGVPEASLARRPALRHRTHRGHHHDHHHDDDHDHGAAQIRATDPGPPDHDHAARHRHDGGHDSDHGAGHRDHGAGDDHVGSGGPVTRIDVPRRRRHPA